VYPSALPGWVSLSLCWPPLLASVAQREAAFGHSGRFTSHTLLAHFERCNQAHCVLVALLSLSACGVRHRVDLLDDVEAMKSHN
jgi:hypothetical protein